MIRLSAPQIAYNSHVETQAKTNVDRRKSRNRAESLKNR